MARWLAVFLMTFSTAAFAQSFTIGEVLEHQLSVCLDKVTAIQILDTDSRSGFEAAAKIWEAEDRCQTVPVVGPKVGQVVHTAVITRDGKKLTSRVVEIIGTDGKTVIGWFLTTREVRKLPAPGVFDGDGPSPDGERRGTRIGT